MNKSEEEKKWRKRWGKYKITPSITFYELLYHPMMFQSSHPQPCPVSRTFIVIAITEGSLFS